MCFASCLCASTAMPGNSLSHRGQARSHLLTSYASSTRAGLGVDVEGGAGPDTDKTGTDTDKASGVGDETGAGEANGVTGVDGTETKGGRTSLRVGFGGHFA